jgi:hypothetical protein
MRSALPLGLMSVVNIIKLGDESVARSRSALLQPLSFLRLLKEEIRHDERWRISLQKQVFYEMLLKNIFCEAVWVSYVVTRKCAIFRLDKSTVTWSSGVLAALPSDIG